MQKITYSPLGDFNDFGPKLLSSTQLQQDQRGVMLAFESPISPESSTEIFHLNPFALLGPSWFAGMTRQIVRCIHGHGYQVSVDVGAASNTFGQWIGQHLTWERNNAVLVPPGFASGFLALDGGAVLMTERDGPIGAEPQRLRWNCGEVGIKWPLGAGANVIASPTDRAAPGLGAIERWGKKA